VVDILAAGCDAGIRYDDKVTKNMVLTPIGPSRQRFATAASPAYLARHGYPLHPQDLDRHACLPAFVGGGHPMPWEFENEPHRVCRRLISVSYAAMSSISRAA